MSRGYRSALIAVALAFASVTGAQTPEDTNRLRERAKQQQSEPGETRGAATPVSIQDLIERIANAIEASNVEGEPAYQRERAERSLRAQEWTAISTHRLFLAALASLGLTAIGIGLLWRTLIHTRRAVDEAERGTTAATEAARAAHESNEIIRRMSQIETRAYLAVEPMGINQLIGKDRAIGLIQVRNVGKLPARNVSLTVHMERSDGPEQEHGLRRTTFDYEFDQSKSSDRVIQPHGTMQQGSKDRIPITEICNKEFSQYNIYVWGGVRYEDGHGIPRYTRFCHRYSIASYNRDEDWNAKCVKTRAVISADKARYHTFGNEAD